MLSFCAFVESAFWGHPSAWPVNMQYSIQKTMSGDSSGVILEMLSAQDCDLQISEKHHQRNESGARIRRHSFLPSVDSRISEEMFLVDHKTKGDEKWRCF